MTYFIENSVERVAMQDLYSEEDSINCVILDVLGPSDSIYEEFTSQFEIVGQYLANDDFYQGLNMTTVIRRKVDGMLFGYSWWDDISKHGESYVEANGTEYGFDYDTEPWYPTYVWLPVKEITITGYEVVK